MTRECLEAGVAEVRPGGRLGAWGRPSRGWQSTMGTGSYGSSGARRRRTRHEEPHVNRFGRRGYGLREGMTFTIEPMRNEGSPDIRFLEDGWTVATADGKLSAQYEHTVAVTAEGREILTPCQRYVGEAPESA